MSSQSSMSSSIDLNSLPNSMNENSLSPPRCLQIDLNQALEEDGTPENNMQIVVRQGTKKKNLSNEQKRLVFESLLIHQKNGKLSKGAITHVADSFSICTKSISRIWRDGKIFCTTNNCVVDLSSKMVNRRGRKRIDIEFDKMRDISFRCRTCIRSLSVALGMSKSTVHRRVQDGNIRAHSNAVKPYLSDANKKARLAFCLSMIDEGTFLQTHTFIDMYHRVHIDEKWFYISKDSQRYYIHPNEKEPSRTCKSKQFILKIMFLVVVARPKKDVNTGEVFDGKIGIWPFVVHEPAKRNSRNRVAGTVEMKPILSINIYVIRASIIQKLIPSIKEKWPPSSSDIIYVQQDNARSHLDINDQEFARTFKADGFDIRLCCQPPNNPNLNVLDLGFFRAIDSLQHQKSPSTVEERVASVEEAFYEFHTEELNSVFLTLQSCMVEIMRHTCGNDYKILHMNKHKLMKKRELPKCISFENEILDVVKEALIQ